MQRLLAVLIAVQLVAGGAAVVIDNLPKRTRTVPVDEVALRSGQIEVTGTVTLLRADYAVPAEPLTMPVTVAGGRATITKADVGGKSSTIAWDGGRPLVLAGEGTLDVKGVGVEVDASGVRWLLDGSAHQFSPGGYRVTTPVAVGTGGLATPRASVQFTAGSDTSISTSGGARVARPLETITLEGPGTLHLEGQLYIRTAMTERLGPSPRLTSFAAYRITLTPTPEGLHVTGLLQRQ